MANSLYRCEKWQECKHPNCPHFYRHSHPATKYKDCQLSARKCIPVEPEDVIIHDNRVFPPPQGKPWSVQESTHEATCGTCPSNCNCQDDDCPLLIAKLRALYEAMEKAGAISHKWQDSAGVTRHFEDCPACKYEKLLWPEGRR